MYKLNYRIESNKTTREVEVYAVKLSNTILEGVIKQFYTMYPDEVIIRAYLHTLENES